MTWTINKIFALVIGIILALIGLGGLVIAPTTTVGNMLGLDVDLVHNLVFLVTGVLGIGVIFTAWSGWYNRIVGIFYLLVGIAGLIPAFYFNDNRLLGVMYANPLGNGLHLLVGVILAVAGFELVELVMNPSHRVPAHS